MMKGLKIMVAEDETLVALSIIAQLKELKYQVVGDAVDGVEAVRLCGRLQPDLVIMDINMPRLNGVQAAKIIREKWRVPVIIVSGYSEANLIKEASEAGVLSYLVKPVTRKNLAPAIEIAFKNHREYIAARQETTCLQQKLEERKIMECAKGILMEKNHLTEAQAMKKLQHLSNDRNVKLVEIAREIIAANELFS
jgi:AmiR/NasT family two-component response regulator